MIKLSLVIFMNLLYLCIKHNRVNIKTRKLAFSYESSLVKFQRNRKIFLLNLEDIYFCLKENLTVIIKTGSAQTTQNNAVRIFLRTFI